MTEQDRKDLLLLHAAGALDPAQEQAVNLRLAGGDPAVTGALVEAESVLARLAGTCEPVAPSPGLRKQILDQLPERKSAKPAGRSNRSIDLPAKSNPQPMRLTPGRPAVTPTRWGRLALAASIGGLAVGIPLAIFAKQQSSERALADSMAQSQALQINQSNQANARAKDDLDAAKANLNAVLVELKKREVANSKLSQDLNDKAQALDSQTAALADLRKTMALGDVKFTALSQTTGTGQPNGMVVWDVNKARWLVYFFDLAPPPPGRTYQLWFLPETGNPIPAPVFQVDASGRATMVVDLPKGLAKANVAVTDEPPTGSKLPTGKIRLVGHM